MTSRKFSKLLCSGAIVLGVSSLLCPALVAQGPGPDAPAAPYVETASPAMVAPFSVDGGHKFWDTGNKALFGVSIALSGADFAVTRANLQSGGQELNPMVRIFGRSTAGLAANFAGESVGVIGLSYFFHRTGPHKLERMVSVVNIGGSAGAVTYGLTHR